MADYGCVSRRLPDDDEYLALAPEHKLVWLHLCFEAIGGKCGIFKGGARVLSNHTGLSQGNVTDAFKVFEDYGWLVRDGDYRWIKRFIQYNSNSPLWLRGALQEAQELTDRTRLAQDCIEMYNGKGTPLNAVTTPSDAVPHNRTEQNTQNRTDSKKRGLSPAARLAPPAPVSLVELTAKLDANAAAWWLRYMAQLAIQNKDGKVADSRLAGILTDWLDRIGKEQFTQAGLAYGISEALTRGKTEGRDGGAGYIVTCAKGYSPDDSPRPQGNSRPTPRSLEHEVITYAK